MKSAQGVLGKTLWCVTIGGVLAQKQGSASTDVGAVLHQIGCVLKQLQALPVARLIHSDVNRM
jgi:hypothetical protein